MSGVKGWIKKTDLKGQLRKLREEVLSLFDEASDSAPTPSPPLSEMPRGSDLDPDIFVRHLLAARAYPTLEEQLSVARDRGIVFESTEKYLVAHLYKDIPPTGSTHNVSIQWEALKDQDAAHDWLEEVLFASGYRHPVREGARELIERFHQRAGDIPPA